VTIVLGRFARAAAAEAAEEPEPGPDVVLEPLPQPQ